MNFHRRFRGQRVPLLREVFASVPTSIGLNIEVKTEGDPTWRTQMAPAIVNAIRTHGGSHRVLVSSFNHVFLKKLRRLDPTIALGALVMPLRDVARKPSGLARNLGVSVYVCSRTQLRQRNVVDAHAHGMSVLVYGVTTPAHAIRAARFECDGIITDFPDSMVRLFRTDSLQRQPARKQ